jgi:GntR family transcriptional regulator
MFFSIDTSDDVAIYEQIVRQVKFAIAEGSLQPMQLLPSARQLSGELAINPNTVARAYQQLQAEGVLELLRGRGVAVCINATEKCREARRSLIATRLRGALSEALHGGLTADEIREMLHNELESLDGSIQTVSSKDVSSSTPSPNGGPS